jgi:hypothetical protein
VDEAFLFELEQNGSPSGPGLQGPDNLVRRQRATPVLTIESSQKVHIDRSGTREAPCGELDCFTVYNIKHTHLQTAVIDEEERKGEAKEIVFSKYLMSFCCPANVRKWTSARSTGTRIHT